MDIIRAVISLVTILLFVVPSLLIMSLNTAKGARYKQIRFPAVAFVYSVLCCVLFSLLGRITDWLSGLSFIQNFLKWLSPSGKLEYVTLVYLAIVLNAVILIAFFIIKGIARIRVNKSVMPVKFDELTGLKKAYWRFIDIFYDISSGKGSIRRPWVKISVTLKISSIILSIVYIALLLFLQFPIFLNYSWIPYRFMANCVSVLYLWPVISLVVINEIRWFLDGKVEFSKTNKIVFDRNDRKKIADYKELVEQYKGQFPERFSAYYVAKRKGQVSNFHNDIKAESPIEKAIADQIASRGYTVSENFISCIRHIIEGQNALIDTSLFSGFSEYLFPYLNALLSGGDNILFLCADRESAELTAQYIKDKFKSINNLHTLWTVCSCEDARGFADADILVLTPQSILDNNIFIGQLSFLDKFSTMIIVNAAEVVAKDGGLLALLVHKLTNLIKARSYCSELQYICLSESVPPETATTLKEMLNLHNDLYQCDGYQSFDNTHLMLWNYESDNVAMCTAKYIRGDVKATWAQDNLFGGNASQTYFGVSLPIACVGMKYKVAKICVMSRQSSPNRQIINSMKNQMSRLEKYFGTENGYFDFDNTIILNSVDNNNGHASFIVVEDELFNIPLAIYNYCRFGGTDTTMLHIISKPYMLRDYFAANVQSFIDNTAHINMVTPCTSDSVRIAVIKILCETSEKGIEENELIRRVSAIEPDVHNINEALDFCRRIAFPENQLNTNEYLFSFETKQVFDSDNIDFVSGTYVSLKVDSPYIKTILKLRYAKVEIRGKFFELSTFSDRLWQNYIPSQCIVFKGNMYKITGIDTDNGIVHVVEATDSLDSTIDYIQVRKYSLSGRRTPVERVVVPLDTNDERVSDGYEVERFCSGVTVDTPAYYALETSSPQLNLANRTTPRQLPNEVRSSIRREYESACIISLKIKNVGSNKSDKVAFMLAVIMNEMMKTLFPYSYKCIAVCPVLNDSKAIYSGAMGGKISLAYPQVSLDTEYYHNAADVEVLLIEDCHFDTGVLNVLLRDGQFPFRGLFVDILTYLKWLKDFKDDGNITNKYLYFGSNVFPECFDIDTLIQVLSDYEAVRRSDPKKVDRVASKGICSYCHRDLFNVEYEEINDKAGKNNRKLCADCAKLIVTDEKELLKLYEKTRKYLCETFNIELPENIDVRFASADRIRKRMKTEDQRTVVGFVDPKTRELWVESDAPATNIMDVLAHELTHVWQFDNINMSDRVYIEGHASYVEVQYMYHENRTVFAQWQEASLRKREDEYGEGFRRISAELEKRGDYNSFSYMYELFGEGGTGRPPVDDDGTGTDPDDGDDKPEDDGTGTDPDDGDDKPEDDGTDTDEISRTPDAAPRYAYNLLDDNGKRIYMYLRDEIYAFHCNCPLSEPLVTRDEILRIIAYIKRDSPEIFWLTKEYSASSNRADGLATSAGFTYCMTKATAKKRQKKIDEALNPFISSVNSKMSDYNVVLKIYENIISLVDYDSLGLGENEEEMKAGKPDDLRSIYGVFVKRKAVCAGYAAATQYLLNRVGIECVCIRGYASSGSIHGYHAWNLLKLEGDYYYMDTTWGDHSNTDKKINREGISYDYFCITTEKLLKDHTPDKDFPVPICTATKCNYNKRKGK